MSSKVRVLVVEDSLTVRKRLVEVLQSDSSVQVVAEAADGKSAIELCRTLRPDVITLDMMLPELTGVAVTEYVMAYCPTPILIVSASVNRGELFKTYDALAAGAVDVLEKPLAGHDSDDWNRKFISAVKLVSKIKVITHPRARLDAQRQGFTTPRREGRFQVVAMGASTGGPGAVQQILHALPATFPLPVLLVIHIAEAFSVALAEWLDGQSKLQVRYARDGEPVPGVGEGVVLMAPAGKHLVVRSGRLQLSQAPERHSCRPSVDVLFESVAREFGERSIACLLTGMGKDGAEGLLAARRVGAATIAQNEATSIVFGMPAEAIRLGAAERVLPIGEIAPTLLELTGRSKAAGRQV
jgi:two-component system chemotaxis response regulator CheB